MRCAACEVTWLDACTAPWMGLLFAARAALLACIGRRLSVTMACIGRRSSWLCALFNSLLKFLAAYYAPGHPVL